MMAALKASGLPVLSNARLDDFTATHPLIDGYKPTKDLLLEVGRAIYMNPSFMRDFVKDNDEIGVKVFYDGLPVLPRGDYTVIFMQRDPDEIRDSIERVDRYKKSFNQKDKKRHIPIHPKEINRYPFDVYAEYKPEDVIHSLEIAKQRKDMRVIEVQFKDLIANPIAVFERLRVKGVPVHVDNAQKIVDPDWYRCVA